MAVFRNGANAANPANGANQANAAMLRAASRKAQKLLNRAGVIARSLFQEGVDVT
jgi:cell division septum initiation protein DivIVA